MLQRVETVFTTNEGLPIIVYSSRQLKRKRAGNYPLVAELNPDSTIYSDNSSDFEDEINLNEAMIPSTG